MHMGGCGGCGGTLEPNCMKGWGRGGDGEVMRGIGGE